MGEPVDLELFEDASDNLAQLIDIVSNMDSETYAPVLDQAREVLDRLNEKLDR